MDLFIYSEFILFKLSDSVIRRKVESVMAMFIFYEGVTMETAAILDLCVPFLGNISL